MAKATKKTIEVERVVKDKTEVVTLELSVAEATTLRAVVGWLSPNSDNKRSEHTTNLFHALKRSEHAINLFHALELVVPGIDCPFDRVPNLL